MIIKKLQEKNNLTIKDKPISTKEFKKNKPKKTDKIQMQMNKTQQNRD